MKKVKKLICATLLLLLVAVLFSLSACRDDSTCVLTLDPAGGTLLDASSLKVEKGESVTLPVPVRDGYTFVGWYTGTSVFSTRITDTGMITGDTQLYARWETGDEYKLAYMLNADGRSFSCVGPGTFKGEDVVIADHYKGLPVTDVGVEAFNEQTGIHSVFIPATVETLRGGAFANCTNLERVTFEEGSRLQNIGLIEDWGMPGTFYKCYALTEIEIPKSVVSISMNAFDRCERLQRVIFAPNAELEYIGDQAFYFCLALEEIRIPASVIAIGWQAFWMCRNMKTVSVEPGSQLELIWNEAFDNCVELISAEIPCSVNEIGTKAFSGCTVLQVLYYEGTPEQWAKIYGGTEYTHLVQFAGE